MRDTGLYLAQQYGLDAEYRAISGLPSRGYGESLKNIAVYSIDPGEAAFQDAYELKGRFMKTIQKGGDFQGISSPKSTAIYNYKTAIRYKDKEAVNKYLQEYANLGGTKQGFTQSIKTLHPLFGLNLEERKQFEMSLNEDDKNRVKKAIEFYGQIFLMESVEQARQSLPSRKKR